MKIVITYGTFDLLHYGHVRLLERAKALGDYLIVGVTADDFDKKRGKINTKQSLYERIEAVKNTGLADKIIIEEYEGQKIDDIKKFNVDVFAIGSDWQGKFDYLKAYCEVVYLERTFGISSTQLRQSDKIVRLGYWGNDSVISKYLKQTSYVNGLKQGEIFTNDIDFLKSIIQDENVRFTNNKQEFVNNVDAVYLKNDIKNQYASAKELLTKGKSVLCEDLPCLSTFEFDTLCNLANANNVCFMTALKTAYSIAYHRLLLLIETGIIGEVCSIQSTCTSLTKTNSNNSSEWGAICSWGPTAMLPIFQILGTNFKSKKIATQIIDKKSRKEKFVSINFIYDNAIASIFVSKHVKSEGTLIISGTKGCIYVPAPWWKTDYFEIHFENQNENKKYFYQLDGEGIGNLLLQFYTNIVSDKMDSYVEKSVLRKIVEVIEDFYKGKDVDFLD